MIYSKTNGEFVLSTDSALLDLKIVHGFLSTSYWAKDIPISLVEKSILNSLCFGIYKGQDQLGFARVISDYSTFAYLADVFILPEYRGLGLSKWLVQCILEHPELQRLRRFCLGTRDAHGLYEKFGFKVSAKPENWLEIKLENPYSSKL